MRLSERQKNILIGLGIILCLYFFLVGIKGIGAAFKLFGGDIAERILQSTANPITGLFIGILSTALVQSSSTTTSIIVGMVAGGAISIQGAIPMIMGANIGTTVTNTLVSLGHITRRQEFRRAFSVGTVHDFFNVMAVLILLPLEYFTGAISKLSMVLAATFESVGGLRVADPLRIAVNPVVELLESVVFYNPWLMLLLSVAITFYMLYSIVKLLRALVLEKIEAFFDTYIFKTAFRGFLFGAGLTFIVQSSSVTTSLVVPLVGAGVLTIYQVFPYTIGANIGTTITANLAALATGNVAALTVSIAHLLFNVMAGLIIWPIKTIRHIPIRAADALSQLAVKNRLIPIIFILVMFYLLPILVILLGGGSTNA